MISTLRQPIIFDGTSTPVKTALFVIICAAWILPGLIGHEPWRPDDAVAFGVIHSMLTDGGWIVPAIAGVSAHDYPPLYFWVAALFAKVFSFVLPTHDAARLATGFFLVIALTYLHKTARRLFDERAGRIAVLLLLGSLGLLWRGHQMNPEVAGLAGLSIAIYGIARLRSEPTKAGWILGLGAGVIALSTGLLSALVPFMISLVVAVVLREWKNPQIRRGFAIALLVALPFAALFPVLLLIAGQPMPIWFDTIGGLALADLQSRRISDIVFFARILPWFGLPALPFALWVWARDHEKMRERIELALPFAAFITILVVLSFTRKASDGMAFPLLLPLALAGAYALDRLSRSIASFMDWFSLIFFGIVAIAGWLYWTAAITGTPIAAANAVARQVPGFTFTFAPIPFLVAVAFTLLWLYATLRAHRNNRRAVVNWTAGITLVWLLANLLGMSAMDQRLSYRSTVLSMMETLSRQPTGCTASRDLGDSQRAMVAYYANLRFIADDQPAAAACNLLLVQGTRGTPPNIAGNWLQIWDGARPGDNVERLYLFRR